MRSQGAGQTSWEQVVATYQAHIQHYAAHGGGENALIGSRAEGSVTLQYAGRVVYELFQNALDRAASRVVVSFQDGRLLVGNDGDGISVDPAYDYAHPIEGEGRSDFHALCALHTSNKSADRQFGNKGIGFRSVFGVSDSVTLWSRCLDGGWWGLELRQRLCPAEWIGSVLPELDALVRAQGTQPRPSFHFPRLLRAAEPPSSLCAQLSTVVLVDIQDPAHASQIAQEVGRLQGTRFQFVGFRRPGLTFVLADQTLRSESGWPLITGPIHHQGFPALAQKARDAQHPVAAPRIAVAWPPPSEQPPTGLFYNHLPTQMSTGLPVDVHGDFQVKADREGMVLEDSNAVGAYNRALLQKAAEAHVEALLQEARKPAPRPDLWQLASRPEGASIWAQILQDILFPGGKLDRWVELAESALRSDTAENTCRAFWNASLRWLEALARYGHWTKAWLLRAQELCDLLAAKEIAAIPIRTAEGTQVVPLPSRQERGQRAARRVFYWSPRGDAEIPPVPDVLLDQGRVVTAFDLGAFTIPAGVQPFAEAEIIPDLRQLPNQPGDLDTARCISPAQQADLLRFAYRLAGSRRVAHFAWRIAADSEDGIRAGRALSSLFLPNQQQHWEPARQLTAGQIDQAYLGALLGDSVPLAELFPLLGVAPEGAVALCEGGMQGWVAPLPLPPAPQAAGTRPVAPLEPLLPAGTPATAVLHALSGLPPDSDRSHVRAWVRDTPWLSAAQFLVYEGLPLLADPVAPLEVVYSTHDPQRIFFAVPDKAVASLPWRELGALHKPDDEGAPGQASMLLRRLAARIPAPDRLSASHRFSLVALYSRLAERLDPEDQDIPVLVEQSRRLFWLRPGEEAWLARREERQELRRFFPDLPLVVAEYRDRLPELLQVPQVRLRRKVYPEVSTEQESPRAAAFREAISPHLPLLAAAAEQSRLALRTLSPERLSQAWFRQAPIVEVQDAWIEFRVEGPDHRPFDWRKDSFDDVFHLPSEISGDPGRIIFDVAPDARATARPIPLRFFGDALAGLLVNNTALGPLFSQILASIDEGREQDYQERSHLRELVDEWTRKLHPLQDSDRATLAARLGQVCQDAARVLRVGRLTISDLGPARPATTGATLSAWLQQGLAPALHCHLPIIVIENENRERWRLWLRQHQTPLGALLATLAGVPATWKAELAQQAEARADDLDFVPQAVVQAYLSAQGHEIGDLDARLREIAPLFQDIQQAPRLAAAVGWSAGQGRSSTGSGGPHRKLTPEDILEESILLGAYGDAAERALLAWVVREARTWANDPGFQDAILSALAPSSKTWKETKAALEAEDLERALHIAARWSGAGFDILGVEQVEGVLVPVRYECKGIAAQRARACIHLSRNELGVARRVHRSGPGRWMLVGVQPDGLCADLTPLIQDLIDEDEQPLVPLYSRGLEPDGLRLIVERTASAALPPE